MKHILFFWVFVVAINVCAQDRNIAHGCVKGRLRGDEGNDSLVGATIAILHAVDSSLSKATFSGEGGDFMLDRLQAGEYKLYIEYLGYKVVWRSIAITQTDTLIDLGIISMLRAGITLAVVEVINEKAPMVVKMDTLEFNAGSFNARENAVVEELLKRLPGIQVERDGTIMVNGEIVKKLLVDGKPFFGSDPKVATRNLPADIIEKIQFIDRKSNWSQFTGINDGQKEKTINLTIKKDRKGGYFARAGGALANGGRSAVNCNVSQFKSERQLAFGANGSDINGYGDNGGPSQISIGNNSRVRHLSIGSNYNQDFGRKLKVGSEFTLNSNNTEDIRSSTRLNILPDTVSYYNKDSRVMDTNTGQALNTWMEFIPDTLHMVNISVSLGYSTSKNLEEDTYTSLGGGQQLINSGAMRNTSVGSTPTVSVDVLFGKKFRKNGRTFSINLATAYNSRKLERLNKSNSLFVKPDSGWLVDSIDQRNEIYSLSSSVGLSLIYTEPLMKDHYLEFTYMYSTDQSTSNKSTYDYDSIMRGYNSRNGSLSNIFENRSSIQQAGIRLLSQKGKHNYTVGMNIQFNNFDNDNISEDKRITQHSINFFPSATFNYIISISKRIQFSYSGRTQQPGISQLQPVPDTRNPLYIQLGDPDLKPSFNNSFNVSYTALNAVTLRNFSAGVRCVVIANKIVNISWFDSVGRQVSQPRNVNGSFNVNSNISTSIPLKRKQSSLNTNIAIGFSRDVSVVNEVLSEANGVNVTPGISVNYDYKELLGFAAAVNTSYSRVRYNLQKDRDTWFLNYGVSLDGYINLPFGTVIGGNLDFARNAGKDRVYSQNVAMLNMFISKSLFKQKKGTVRLQGMDLLNRSVGISRNVGTNYIEDVRTAVMQRYVLISFSYFINRFGERKH